METMLTETSRSLVYKINYDFGITATDIVKRLETEDWVCEQPTKLVNQNRLNGGRWVLANAPRGQVREENIKDPVIKEIFKHVTGHTFKRHIVETLIQNDNFCRLWGVTNPDLLDSLTVLTANLVIDQMGCNIKLHLDNRMLLATGMLYLNEKPLDGGAQHTVFYTDENKSNPMPMETGPGNGWFAVNMQNNWHEGFNKSIQKRYSILLGLSLNLDRIRKTNT